MAKLKEYLEMYGYILMKFSDQIYIKLRSDFWMVKVRDQDHRKVKLTWQKVWENVEKFDVQ